ncbi:MAG: DUF1549 domain-containing protein [Gemmataceae bacterium]
MKLDRLVGCPSWVCMLALALAGIGSSSGRAADEKLPPNAKILRLEAQPSSVRLKNPFEYSQLLITGHLDNGDKVDVTRLAKAECPANLAKISATGQVRPVGDGIGEIKFAFGGQQVVVPVTVSGQKEKYEVSFVRDVMPTLSKMGCNAGTCHGAQNGKNGFKLSLRGYDPILDHRALTDDLAGRRFDRAAPDASLMLLKPSGAAPHVGGVLTKPGEPYYELLRAWIAAGVKLDLNAPHVSKIEIFPKGPVVPLIGMKQQTAVMATFSDGSVRDVSAEAFIESSNTEIATVDKLGLVTSVRRGEAAMLARYEGAYTATTLIVMGDRSGYSWKDVLEFNYIDSLVDEKLKSVKLLPSEICTDAEFIRRIYLDLTGLPPQSEQVRAFLADQTPTKVKRDELVDKLIGSPEYIEHWTNKWADLLQVNRKFLGEQGASALRNWIKDAVTKNMPYDKMVYTILTASGSTLENPPAAYYKVLREPGPAMENTTQLFLAVRFNCNKCHDHPFERWTQDQYYQLAAYFAQVSRTEDPKFKGQKIGGTDVDGATPLVENIADLSAGDVKHDRTGKITPPKFPYQVPDQIPEKAPRREQLAKWITSKENPYFAKSYVNRIWSYMLGVGIIEPIDDIRAGNPPSNPKLLDRLTAEFIQSGFNVRELERTICKSRVYQQTILTNKWNEDDDINYSHAMARRLPAEVLFDAIHRATGALSKIPGLPPGTRAAQLLDSSVEIPSGFLDLFGKPPRESACECERSSGMMLGPVLNLVNGPIVGEAINDPANRLAKLVATEKDDAKIVEELFIAVLNRPPTKEEIANGLKAISDTQDEYNRLVEEHKKRQDALAAYEKQIPAKQAEWEKTYKDTPVWTVLDPTDLKATGKTVLTKQADGSILATGDNPHPSLYTIAAKTTLKGITGIRLEVLPDDSLPAKGPGRAPNGNFVLNECKVTGALPAKPGEAKPVVLHHATADFSQEGWAVAGAIDGKPETGWAVMPQFGKKHTAIFEVKEPSAFAEEMLLTFTLDQQFPGKEHNIGKFRLAVTTAKGPFKFDGPPEAIAKALATPAEQRTTDQKAEITNYFRSLDPELARLNKELADHQVPADKRLLGVQDLAWALINSPAFLFNH